MPGRLATGNPGRSQPLSHGGSTHAHSIHRRGGGPQLPVRDKRPGSRTGSHHRPGDEHHPVVADAHGHRQPARARDDLLLRVRHDRQVRVEDPGAIRRQQQLDHDRAGDGREPRSRHPLPLPARRGRGRHHPRRRSLDQDCRGDRSTAVEARARPSDDQRRVEHDRRARADHGTSLRKRQPRAVRRASGAPLDGSDQLQRRPRPHPRVDPRSAGQARHRDPDDPLQRRSPIRVRR